MRHRVLFAISLTFALTAANPVSAQRVTSFAAKPSAGQLTSLVSDSLYSRMRALGLLPRPSLAPDRVTTLDTIRGRPDCPMPILHPDSTRRFAATAGQPLHSADRMPTQPSMCTNSLDTHP